MTGPKIILATVGSLGDLHPFIAVGQALQARGAQPVLAVPLDHVGKCRAAGLEAEAVLPSFAELGAATGLPDDEIVRRIIDDMDFLVRQILLRSLADSVERLKAVVQGADIVAASVFALGAPIAAEALAIPFVPMMLQPMTWFSPLDPPLTPDLKGLARPPLGPIKAGWNRMMMRVGGRMIGSRYAGAINAVRAAHGLSRSTRPPLLQPGTTPIVSLGLYSPELAELPADAPEPSRLTGFPFFDSEDGAPPVMDERLVAFLAEGSPPIVVSLGSFVPYAGKAIYRDAAAIARALGMRAVLLTGEGEEIIGPDILTCHYAPHSLLFPHAAAIIHHGGVGTTGQALQAGKPQLIVPFMGDQFDHADRLSRRGLALTVLPSRFGRDGEGLVRRLLEDGALAAAARRAGERIRQENGAGVTAEALLRQAQSGKSLPS